MKNDSSENLKNNSCIFLVFASLFVSPNAFAYLDPGTGAMIVQAVIAMFIGAGIFFNHMKFKILDFYKAILKKIKGKDEKEEQIEEKQEK